MEASRTISSLRAAGNATFEICSTLMVWIGLFLNVMLVQTLRTPPPSGCGQPEMSFLVAVSAVTGLVLLILVYDTVQALRGKLSTAAKWFRTVPGAMAVLIAAGGTAFRLLGS